MREEFRPAIETLQKELSEIEQQASELRQIINRLCVKAGVAPLYPETQAAAVSAAGIRPDSFYGKTLTAASREYLEMRKAGGSGPATPRQVYEALIRGGYQFETKDEGNAIIGVRATLRKNSAVFHRLPNGEYGLLSWYPNARAPKDNDEE